MSVDTTPPQIHFGTAVSYLDRALSPYRRDELWSGLKATAEYVEESGHDFDTIVVTGISGLLVGPMLAHQTGKLLAVVRKKDDVSNHSGNEVEGYVGERWIFLDDLIDSGASLNRVRDIITERAENEGAARPEFIGALTYACDPHFRSHPKLAGRYPTSRDPFGKGSIPEDRLPREIIFGPAYADIDCITDYITNPIPPLLNKEY